MRFLCFALIVGGSILSCLPRRTSTETENHQRTKRDRPLTDLTTGMTQVLKLLAVQEEKIKELQLGMVINKFTPNCVGRIKLENLIGAGKCWMQLEQELKRLESSVDFENSALNQIAADAYDGDQARLLVVTKFITENVEKGSSQAFLAYKTLLTEMYSYGHLYMGQVLGDTVLGGGIVSYTHRVLFSIADSEGENSTAFANLPGAEKDIFLEKEVFIRNNFTGTFMSVDIPVPCGSKFNCSSPVWKVFVDSGNGNDPKYLWKFKPVKSKWQDQNYEVFNIFNSMEDKMLAVGSGGTMKVTEATSEQLKRKGFSIILELGISHTLKPTLGYPIKKKLWLIL